MSNNTRQCPVCRSEVIPTRTTADGGGRNICGHLDKAGAPCPGSYRIPFDLAINLNDPPAPDELRTVLAQIHEMSRRGK